MVNLFDRISRLIFIFGCRFVYELRQVKEQDSTQGPEDAEEKKNQ